MRVGVVVMTRNFHGGNVAVVHGRIQGLLSGVALPLDSIAEVGHGRKCARHCGGHVAGVAFGGGDGCVRGGRSIGRQHHLLRGRRVVGVSHVRRRVRPLTVIICGREQQLVVVVHGWCELRPGLGGLVRRGVGLGALALLLGCLAGRRLDFALGACRGAVRSAGPALEVFQASLELLPCSRG